MPLARSFAHPYVGLPIIDGWLLNSMGSVISDSLHESGDRENQLRASWTTLKATWIAVAMPIGKSLDHLLRECINNKYSGIDAKELIHFIVGSAKAIDFLNLTFHDIGASSTSLRHCNLKPTNILIVGDEAVVSDCDLSQVGARRDAVELRSEISPFMSPELVSDSSVRTS